MKSFVKFGVFFALGIVLSLGSCDFEPPGRTIYLMDNIDPIPGGETPGEAGTYTLTFNSNARDSTGTMEDNILTADAKEKLRKNTYARTGYAFTGWTKTAEGEAEYADEETVTNLAAAGGMVTLYAVWKVNTYTVVYDPNGGTGTMEDSVFTVGVEETLRENTFTNTGYTFAGWAAAADEEDVIYADEDTVTNLAAAGDTVTLYAVWSSRTYTVVYNRNGGTGTMANSVFIVDASAKLRNNTFSKPGYAFAGWATTTTGSVVYADQANVKNLTAAGGTVTLYAKWNVNTYTVVYDPNGGSGTDMEDSVFTAGVEETLQQNAYTNTGYTFVGWSVTAGGASDYADEENVIDLAEAGDTVTLYAVWSSKTYTVVYNSNGGTGTMVNSAYSVGVSGKLRKNTFTRTGHAFAGWAATKTGPVARTDEESVKDLTTTAGATVTLYAVWNVNTYTVVYNPNGGSGTAMENSDFTVGVSANLRPNTYTRTDYTFAGWAAAADGTVAHTDEESVTDLAAAGATVTLYAVWKANTYTVVYDANGGSGTAMENSDFTIDVSANLRPNTYTRTDYTFAGWAAAADGTVAHTDEESVTNLAAAGGTVTLYAAWSAKTYTVVYDANGGSGTMADSSFTVGVSANLRTNAYTYTGYTFDGWAETTTGPVAHTDGKSVTDLAAAGGTITLYAVWEANTYTVKYDANGGSGTAMENSDFTIDVSANLRANTYARTDYTFAGWAETKTGAVAHTDGKSVKNLTTTAGGTVTLYAVWNAAQKIVRTINNVSVSFQRVPAGKFQRSSGTLNTSTISNGYWMSETEVTQELFEAIMGTNPSSGKSSPADGETQEKRPVEKVSWYDAIAFCNKLSLADGKDPVYTVSGINWTTLAYSEIPTTSNDTWNAATMDTTKNGYRLPTEMEWMWAAMGADTTDPGKTNTTGYKKDFAGSGSSIDDYAWTNTAKTHEVGKKFPNELGLYDMSGNVAEWCWDWLGGSTGTGGAFGVTGPVTDYKGANSGDNRVRHGGSYLDPSNWAKIIYRDQYGPHFNTHYTGIRLVRS